MLNRHSIVSVVGGSGFIGSYIVKELAKTGARIKVIARHAEAFGKNVKFAGYVGQISFLDCDIHNKNKLDVAISGSHIVINCIGVLFNYGGQGFEFMHHQHVKNLVEICKKNNIQKLLHISALGIDKALTSKYAQTKLAGERAILSSGLNYTILRPSVVFGPEDGFVNLFANLATYLPALPLFGGGKTKFQPVYVDDLAKAVVNSLTTHSDIATNAILDIGGATIISMKELIDEILKIKHLTRFKITLPFIVGKIKGAICDALRLPIISKDQIELLRYDNVVSGSNDIEKLGIEPRSILNVMPTYL
jgi:uncharacterized protein YbjT (DUF2867 family)